MKNIFHTKLKNLFYNGIIASTICYLLLSNSDVNAYSWRSCEGYNIAWFYNSTNMYISTTSFPAGSSADTRLQNAMWHWNNVKGSKFNFYVGRDTDGSHSSSNRICEIYLANETGDALAVTFTRYICYWEFGWKVWLTEADICFNSTLSWNTSDYSYANPTGSPYNFEGVALHELGHALGLGHEDRVMATMNSYYPNSGPFGSYREWDPWGDDRNGVRYLYSDETTETDIAASPLKRTGTGYSNLVSCSDTASKGSTATLEYTISNLGTDQQTFDIGFYLSQNDFISTGDIFLGASTVSAPRGSMGTFTRTLTIPKKISRGYYYLGFIVDYKNAISDVNGFNDSQQMPRTIKIKRKPRK